MRTYAVVMAAGKGTRMKSDKPKVVHEVLYKPMINHIVDELKQVGVDEIYVIVGHKANEVEKLLDDVNIVYQHQQLGTGHALMQYPHPLQRIGSVYIFSVFSTLIFISLSFLWFCLNWSNYLLIEYIFFALFINNKR